MIDDGFVSESRKREHPYDARVVFFHFADMGAFAWLVSLFCFVFVKLPFFFAASAFSFIFFIFF